MKFSMVFFMFIACVFAQRGSYAGSRPHGVPQVAYRFRNTNTNDNTISGNAGFGDRWHNDGQSIPLDSTNKIYENWPHENKPFWYVNRDIINKQIGLLNTPKQIFNTNSMTRNNQLQPTIKTVVQDRFSGTNLDSDRFYVVKNGQSMTYEYDPVSDTWYRRRV